MPVTTLSFEHYSGKTTLRYESSSTSGFEYRLRPTAELFEGDRPFVSSDIDDWDNKYVTLPAAHSS